ncbi:MAG TPA: 2-phospho-L-lactate transferase [Methanobacteriaceae archaeon]|nr:2-phospho-L-lactate transferase [Methanobacteriaceae archaeon]HNS24453.1 2-phospho-L-lactate transferase [Methanobacteriaceae archaeon]
MITVFSGGTGTPKLLQGMVEIIDPADVTVIVNTLENEYFSGVYVAADLDTVMYTLAGMINQETWYGIEGDTFVTHDTLKRMGCPEILRIGDEDRGIKIQKTILMNKHPLSEAVEIQKERLGIKSKILPMSDQDSNLTIQTTEGKMDFHQFLVEKQGRPHVLDINYEQVDSAPGVIEAIKNSEMVLVGPSNPITSIGPIISTKGVMKALKNAYVVAISPIIGDRPVSGPAAKFMAALGYEVSCLGVARIYQDFLDKFVIDNIDAHYKDIIEKLITEVVVTQTKMNNQQDKVKLARMIFG